MISTEDILHSIAVNVVHSDHIDFLKSFANSYLGADTLNEEILRPAFLRLVKKYKLDEECEFASFSRRILSEELVGVTTIKEFEPIEKIKGSCPKCGGPLEFKEHVDTFNEDGSPIAEDTCRDPYCPSCKLLWLSQEASE